MRKRITKNLLTAVALCTALSAEAYDFEAGGIYYNITSEADKTVEVTFGNNSYSGDIAIPSTVSNGASTYTVTLIGSSAFESCVDITSIAMPEGVTGIGRTAFLFCSGLISVNIPKGVTEIGDYAFEGCERLTEINCLATVPPTCGKGCFSSVDKDKCTLNVPIGTEDAYKAAKGWNEFFSEAHFVINEIKYAITSSELRTVEVIAGDNKYIGNIEIPATVSYGGTTYAVTSVGECAFEECVSLISINIPNSVVSIGEDAFSWCSSLSSVNIPSGVTRIENGTFFGCSSLTSTNIPEGVTSIGEAAFYWCTSLASITIPNSVTIIGDYAFSDCSSLTSITIPDGVTEIGEGAFSGCSGLTEIYCAASIPPACRSYCFLNVDKSDCTLYVPEGTADAYKAADEWKDFYNIVETDFSGTEEIAADAAADVKVYAAAGRIVVENAAAGTPIAVYTADGVQVYGGTASDGRTEISAQAGKLYIVRCGNAAYKTAM